MPMRWAPSLDPERAFFYPSISVLTEITVYSFETSTMQASPAHLSPLLRQGHALRMGNLINLVR